MPFDRAWWQRNRHDMSQDITCFEEGSGELPWLGSASMLRDDIDQLRRLAQDGVITLEQRGARYPLPVSTEWAW